MFHCSSGVELGSNRQRWRLRRNIDKGRNALRKGTIIALSLSTDGENRLRYHVGIRPASDSLLGSFGRLGNHWSWSISITHILAVSAEARSATVQAIAEAIAVLLETLVLLACNVSIGCRSLK